MKGRALVVEDLWLVAMDLQAQLEDLGAEEVYCAHRLDDGFRLVEEAGPFDLALLDINIGTQLVFPLADELRDQGTPIIFVTAQQRLEFPDEWKDRAPLVRKPLSSAILARAITNLSRSSQGK